MNTLEIIGFFLASLNVVLWAGWIVVFVSRRRKKNDPKDPCAGAKLPTLDVIRDLIDNKTSNCLMAGGDTHKELRENAPSYYILTTESCSGRRVGRLFTGRNAGLALTTVLAWKDNTPSLLTEEEMSEYATFNQQANDDYDAGVAWNTEEVYGKGGARHTPIRQWEAIAAIAKAQELGAYIHVR